MSDMLQLVVDVQYALLSVISRRMVPEKVASTAAQRQAGAYRTLVDAFQLECEER
jgi:hypothetical protein